MLLQRLQARDHRLHPRARLLVLGQQLRTFARDLLVLLAPGEGAPTLSDASPFQVVAELGTEAASLSLDRAALVGELARLQRTTRCVTLTGHADESTLDALDALS